MDLFRLKEKDKISIEEEIFEIAKITKKEILLRPNNPEILSSKILIDFPKEIVLDVVRKIDCEIKPKTKSIGSNGKIYQIIKKRKDVIFNKESREPEKIVIYYLYDVKLKEISKKCIIKLIENEKGEKILYDSNYITEDKIKKVE